MLSKSETCVVVTGSNPEGSIADDTYYFRCGEPAVGERDGFPMCTEHMALFSEIRRSHTRKETFFPVDELRREDD